MEEGSRPMRLRGTPAGKHRHYFALIAVTVSVATGLFMEFGRSYEGHMSKILNKKQDDSAQTYLTQKNVFGHQLYGRDKALVKSGQEMADRLHIHDSGMN
ncbi:hypothetical protein CHUAL_010164 [Chamberlinius hualienensis]